MSDRHFNHGTFPILNKSRSIQAVFETLLGILWGPDNWVIGAKGGLQSHDAIGYFPIIPTIARRYADEIYVSFDKIDAAASGKMQVLHDAAIRVEFDTFQATLSQRGLLIQNKQANSRV